MKRSLLLLSALFISYLSFSQTVENIRVEAEGDNIKINYRIGGSTDAQLYTVVLSCSMDGGPRFEPSAVIGDVGQNIRGGRSYYTVIWDVFEDLDEVGEVEFFVKLVLTSDQAVPVNPYQEKQTDQQSTRQEKITSPFDQDVKTKRSKEKGDFDRNIFIAYSGSDYNMLGFSAGMLGNWGFYASFRYGGYDDLWMVTYGSVTGGVTKHFLTRGKYRLHGYAGAGVGDFFDELDIEAGLTNIIANRLVLSAGIAYPTWYAEVVIGIGIVF